ncbi:hypothetical protein MF271_07735 [Deinococcus sp. KNUC1210]|uniref:hypothetical protein n=1 Tax=Deinococcus sp. KNUC1210 TaxID=2917691 RepID=UPI001EF09D60|nr:hypothetical protein [Deinococcus sp. KNUC1210]ULH16461.1 hypothetical protein MF271_07735 [Deinococcus sp. KNUC1210]
MDRRLNIVDFDGTESCTVAAISRQDRQDWFDFDWSVQPIKEVDLPSDLLSRLGFLGQAYEMPLLSRLSWTQARFSGEKMPELLDECQLLFDIINDEASAFALQEIGKMVNFVERHQQYPNILLAPNRQKIWQ